MESNFVNPYIAPVSEPNEPTLEPVRKTKFGFRVAALFVSIFLIAVPLIRFMFEAITLDMLINNIITIVVGGYFARVAIRP